MTLAIPSLSPACGPAEASLRFVLTPCVEPKVGKPSPTAQPVERALADQAGRLGGPPKSSQKYPAGGIQGAPGVRRLKRLAETTLFLPAKSVLLDSQANGRASSTYGPVSVATDPIVSWDLSSLQSTCGSALV